MTIEQEVKEFCSQIGKNPLLVQGAGGNVSWKDAGTLWIKASGTWLENAQQDIFVPVDLLEIQRQFLSKQLDAKPNIVGDTKLRPSIETMLHALMKHRVVVHIHAIDILAYLVRENAKSLIFEKMHGDKKWVFVDYAKPGKELSDKTATALNNNPSADTVFMKNHGVLVGGNTMPAVNARLQSILRKFECEPFAYPALRRPTLLCQQMVDYGYTRSEDDDMFALSCNEMLLQRLENEWALYPDHVVFLGGKAPLVDITKVQEYMHNRYPRPSFVIVKGNGLYESPQITKAERLQLKCYFNVVSRQSPGQKLDKLTVEQVNDLVNWDAEKYRKSVLNE